MPALARGRARRSNTAVLGAKAHWWVTLVAAAQAPSHFHGRTDPRALLCPDATSIAVLPRLACLYL